MTITKLDLKHSFRAEVSSMPGGELATRCFDCGTCTGVCPVSEAEPDFDPRKIIHMIRMGLKDQLLGSEAIWFCSHCDTCAFVCPQEVVFSNVVDVLREMAIKEGYVEPGAFHNHRCFERQSRPGFSWPDDSPISQRSLDGQCNRTRIKRS